METVTEGLVKLGYPDRGRRLTAHVTWMNVALLVSLRSTCFERRVGAVALNYMGRVLATGYNGPPPGVAHCLTPSWPPDDPGPQCEAGWLAHESRAQCGAIHAEYNALTSCDMREVATVYVTTAPCTACVQLLLASGCRNLFYWQESENSDLALWTRSKHSPVCVQPSLALDGSLGRPE